MEWRSSLTDMALVCGAIVSAGGATVALYRFHVAVIIPIRDSAVSMTQSLLRLPELIDTSEKLLPMVPLVDVIAREFRPNGGSSLHDKLQLVTRQLTEIDNGLSHNRNLAKVMISKDPVPHFETDAQGACVWVNAAYAKMTGLTYEECLGFGWHNAVAIEDREMVAREWEEALRHGKTFIGRYRFIHTSGTAFHVRCRTSFSRNSRGEVTGSVGYVTQDTWREEHERRANA